MKHDYRMNWTLPALPLLGPAIKPREELDWDPRIQFETGDWQIKGAAQAPRSESVRGVGKANSSHLIAPEAAPPFKVGDRVRVVRKAEPDGWDNEWVPSMDKYLGRVFVIDSDNGTSGLRLIDGNFGFSFHSDSLELA